MSLARLLTSQGDVSYAEAGRIPRGFDPRLRSGTLRSDETGVARSWRQAGGSQLLTTDRPIGAESTAHLGCSSTAETVFWSRLA
jgi:hypothetical protein